MENLVDLEDAIHKFLENKQDPKYGKDKKKLLILPDSTFKKYWDLILVLVMIYICTYFPYRICFKPNTFALDFYFWLEFIVDFIFFVDIFVNFITAADVKGTIIQDRRKIAEMYIKSCAPFYLIGMNDGATNSDTSIVRVLKFLRLLKIFRIFKGNPVFDRIMFNLKLNYISKQILKNLIYLAVFIHFVGCIWFYLTTFQDPTMSWIYPVPVDQSSSFSKYLVSIYFALVVSFTVGYGDIVPRSYTEYIFVIFYLLIGVSLYSYTISNLTSLFGRLSERDNYLQERENAIREFAMNHNLSEDLYLEIRNYLLDNDTNKKNFLNDKNHIQNINELTDTLPANLYYELYVNNFKSHLKKFNFLQDCDDKFYFVFISLFEIRLYNKNDIIFKQGDDAAEVYILWKGKFCLVNSLNFENFDEYLERKKPIISKYNQENNNLTLMGGINKGKVTKPKVRRKYLEEKQKNMMYFTEGDLIGENDIKKSDGKVRKFTLKAEEDSVAIIITVNDLKYLCEYDEKFKEYIDDSYKKKEGVIKFILNSLNKCDNIQIAEKMFKYKEERRGGSPNILPSTNFNKLNSIGENVDTERTKLLNMLMNRNRDYKYLESLLSSNPEYLKDDGGGVKFNIGKHLHNNIYPGAKDRDSDREIAKSNDENIYLDRLIEKVLDERVTAMEDFDLNGGLNLNLMTGNGDSPLKSPVKIGESSKFSQSMFKEGQKSPVNNKLDKSKFDLNNDTINNKSKSKINKSIKSKSQKSKQSNFSSFDSSEGSKLKNNSINSSDIQTIKTRRKSTSKKTVSPVNSKKIKAINSKKMNMIKSIFNLSPILRQQKQFIRRVNSCHELPVSVSLENFEFVNLKKKQDNMNIQLVNLLNLKKFQIINPDIFPVVHEVNLLFRKIFKTMKNYVNQFEELRRTISINNQDAVREVMYSINEIFSLIYGIIDIINKIKTVKLSQTLSTFQEYAHALKQLYDERIDNIQENN